MFYIAHVHLEATSESRQLVTKLQENGFTVYVANPWLATMEIVKSPKFATVLDGCYFDCIWNSSVGFPSQEILRSIFSNKIHIIRFQLECF